ncbi:hypothetical protein [Agromyces sp. LHK192]|uniref:hypothetical protein n=1 Tax=Agromyces sp. LHK192 TaxID=2498704 RepID=UPI000FD9CB00|nr:hypothetical protein [Agromyces sp. LHK192]
MSYHRKGPLMFRRWRRRARLVAETAAHVAPKPRESAADLRGEHIFELLNAKLAEFIGGNGQWALVRRTPQGTDRIFDAVVTHQIAADLTRVILEEREQVAVVVPQGEESMALGWEPAPLIVWADPATRVDADTDDDDVRSIAPARLDSAA